MNAYGKKVMATPHCCDKMSIKVEIDTVMHHAFLKSLMNEGRLKLKVVV
jgi:hypothetical protein